MPLCRSGSGESSSELSNTSHLFDLILHQWSLLCAGMIFFPLRSPVIKSPKIKCHFLQIVRLSFQAGSDNMFFLRLRYNVY